MNHQLGSLTNANFVSLSYSNSIQTKNLDLTEGVLGQGTLSIELHNSISGTYLYKVDNEVIGNFTVKSCVKSGDTYKATLYDYVGMLNETQRKNNTTAGTFGYATHSSTNGITHGTYASSSSATLTEADYFTADVGLVTSQPYYAITVHMPERHGLWLGKKFTLEGYTGYVQSISWDIDTYTISCQVEEADNTESQIEQVESQIIQQGSQITSLEVGQGIIEAKVERKNAVYKQSTAPSDTEGTGESTKYDLLNTGDLWYFTGTTTSTYTNGKWYACTATGTHEGGNRVVSWALTEDATISQNSARITVTEDAIEQEVVDRQTAITGERTYVTTNYSTTTQTATEIATKVGEAKEEMEEYTDDAVEGERTYLTNNYSTTSQTASAISTAVVETKTYADGKASTAETNAKDYADDAVAGERTYLTTNYSTTTQTATNINNAVTECKTYTDDSAETLQGYIDINAGAISAEVTRATTAEAGKIDSTGTLTKTGMSWNLTNSDWTVNTISGETTTAVLKVDSSGLTINGKGTFNGNVMVPNATETFNCVQVYGPYTGVPAGVINTTINRGGMSIIDSPTTEGFPIYYTNYTKSGISVSKTSGTYTDAKLTCDNLVCSGAVRNSAPPSEGATEANIINGTIRFYWQ